MCKKNIFDAFDDLWNNDRLKQVTVATTVMCLMAHAFCYFNATFFHDRNQYFMPPVFNSAQRAKWMAQFVDLLASYAYLPWLFGILSIVFFTISIYMITDMLSIKKRLSIWLVAGVCITNISIIAANFYWSYEILVALPLACASAWIWNKNKFTLQIRMILEIVFICASLATYGAYASVAPTLVIIMSIMDIFEGKNENDIIKRGIEYIISFLFGMILYYVILIVMLKVQHLELYTYGGEEKLVAGVSISEVLNYMGIAYRRALKQFVGISENLIPLFGGIAALFVAGGLFIAQICYNKRKISVKAYIILVMLLLVYPLSSGLIYVMSFNNVHELMVFTFVLIYVGYIKLAEESANIKGKSKYFSYILVIILVTFVYKGILVSNMAYMRLDNMYTVSKSIATRVIDRIESCDGFQGNETIEFVGDLSQSEYFRPQQEESNYLSVLHNLKLVRSNNLNSFSYVGVMYMFMTDVMGVNLRMERYSPEAFEENERKMIDEMPLLPADGSVKKMGDKIIVKIAIPEAN